MVLATKFFRSQVHVKLGKTMCWIVHIFHGNYTMYFEEYRRSLNIFARALHFVDKIEDLCLRNFDKCENNYYAKDVKM